MRKTGSDNRVDLLMRTSDPALLDAAGIKERRRGDRRSGDRRDQQGSVFRPITNQ